MEFPENKSERKSKKISKFKVKMSSYTENNKYYLVGEGHEGIVIRNNNEYVLKIGFKDHLIEEFKNIKCLPVRS